MNTIIHEFGHCIATEVTDDIPYWFWSRVESQYAHAKDSTTFFPSDYSKRNVSEFFAECFKTYMTNTELLRDINPEMFELMEILNSTSPDKMEVRPLNEEEIKGDLNLRVRPVYVGQGFQSYVRAELVKGAMQESVEKAQAILNDEIYYHQKVVDDNPKKYSKSEEDAFWEEGTETLKKIQSEKCTGKR